MRDGQDTVSESVNMEPGRRPSREMSMTSGVRDSRCAAAFACVAIGQSYGEPYRPLTRCVVVGARGGAQLMATAPHRAQGAVEEVLELGELVVDIDVAFAT